MVLTYILNQYTIEIRLKYSFEFFKKLKEIYDKNCLSKLALDKLNKVFKTLEFDNSRDFFSNFLSKFATKKRLFEFNCYQNMSQIRIPSKKTKKILCLSPTRKFKQIFKLYKDQLSDLTYKQRLLTEGDLKYFLSRQNACFSIITLIHSHKTHILQLSFKRILTKALNSITGEEMTGYKGFSKYSIILLPFKGIIKVINF